MWASTYAVIVHGGTAELDTLHVRAFSQPVDVRPTSIWVGNVASVFYSEIEALDVFDTLGALPNVTIATPTSAPADDVGDVVHHARRRGHGRRAAPDRDLGEQSRRQRDRVGHEHLDDHGRSAAAGRQRHHRVHGRRERQSHARTRSRSPSARLTYSLAEGATGSFFDLDVLIANPTTTPAPATVTFLRQDGPPIVQNLTLARDLAHDAARGPDPGPREPGRRVRPSSRPRRACPSWSSARCSGMRTTTARTAAPRWTDRGRAGCSPRDRKASSTRTCCSRTRARPRRT